MATWPTTPDRDASRVQTAASVGQGECSSSASNAGHGSSPPSLPRTARNSGYCRRLLHNSLQWTGSPAASHSAGRFHACHPDPVSGAGTIPTGRALLLGPIVDGAGVSHGIQLTAVHLADLRGALHGRLRRVGALLRL